MVTRSHTKKAVSKSLIKKLTSDGKNYINLGNHAEVIGISKPTYRMLINTGECRSDVLEKVQKHLNK